MPKKLFAENSKAKQGRSKKESDRELKTPQLKKQEKDVSWRDDDKVTKKQLKKVEAERKKYEQSVKNAEAKALLQHEMHTAAYSKRITKLSRADIEKNASVSTTATSTNTTPNILDSSKIKRNYKFPVETNINKIVENQTARNVNDAINLLDMTKNVQDKHPEKRLRAAYNAFEQRKLVELKLDNPKLKHSQLKAMIFKEWQVSPENSHNSVKKYFAARI